ncbi:MAG: ACT domain-containing protein [Anaerolineae bacterium]|nr:ACT domain-containing protein [Anaerolineae bacterium]
MQLRLLAEKFGVAKLSPPQAFPAWLSEANLFFIARTEDEYSIMCPEQYIPEAVPYSADYRCLRVDGDLAFDEIGVVARVSKPLADAGLSLFLVSTHDRDYVLVRQHDLVAVLEVYQQAGFVMTSL